MLDSNPYLVLNHIRRMLQAANNSVWLERVKSARSMKPVSLREWLKDKTYVETFQVTQSPRGLQEWVPGRRRVSLRASYVLFGTSRRDFAGHNHLFHSDDTYIAVTKISVDRVQISIYAATK